MIDCVTAEKENLRKVVNREKRVKRERQEGKKDWGGKFFMAYTSLYRCIRIPLRP